MRRLAGMAWLAGCAPDTASTPPQDSAVVDTATSLPTRTPTGTPTPPLDTDEPTLSGYAVPTCAAEPDPALTCGGPPSCGHLVDIQIVTTEIPDEATVGGELLDGVYVLVAYLVHAPTQDSLTLEADLEQVVVVSGGTIRGNMGGSGGQFLGYGETFEARDGEYVATSTCPTKGKPGDKREYGFDGVLWRLLGSGSDRAQEAIYLYLGPEF